MTRVLLNLLRLFKDITGLAGSGRDRGMRREALQLLSFFVSASGFGSVDGVGERG
jgi:hypothetical protein